MPLPTKEPARSPAPSHAEIKTALNMLTNAILNPGTPPVVAVDLGKVARLLQRVLGEK